MLMMLSEYSGDPVTVFFRDVSCLLAFGNAWVQDNYRLSQLHKAPKKVPGRSMAGIGEIQVGGQVSRKALFCMDRCALPLAHTSNNSALIW